jgi:hypothetical protein
MTDAAGMRSFGHPTRRRRLPQGERMTTVRRAPITARPGNRYVGVTRTVS